MSRARQPSAFRQSDIAKLVRIAVRVGAERVDVDPVSGKISVILKTGVVSTQNELDSWMAKHTDETSGD
jgi:hypothetical protein